MMSARTTPTWLRDVLGERFFPAEVAVILAFGAATATAVMLALPPANAQPAWRSAVAWLVIADIAAGCLANFTASTNEHYALRPTSRRIFLMVHVHLLVVAWAIGAPFALAIAVWCYAVASGAIVNALAGHRSQRFVAGALLGVALAVLPLSGDAGALVVVNVLFVLKIVYAFAVDHTAPADAPVHAQGLVVRTLSQRDRAAFVELVGEAFAHDPLYTATVGEAGDGAAGAEPLRARRAALTAYLFDMNQMLGGIATGVFAQGDLVAASLVEPPLRGSVRRTLTLIGAALWFLPLGLRLGARASSQLNTYFRATRAAAPPAPHHYLVQLAVRIDRRGEGLGRRLVDEARALVCSHQASEGLALDTGTLDNFARYRAWGFDARDVLEIGVITARTMFWAKGSQYQQDLDPPRRRT